MSHETKEGVGVVGGGVTTVEEARSLHHLATADPERDGLMTGPAHERKYGLEREDDSAAKLRAAGVDPYENGALETADSPAADEHATTPRAARK